MDNYAFKKARVLFVTMTLLIPFSVYSQNSVGIGTEDPNDNAVLELVSPNGNQGFLVPRLTTTQRNAITGLDNSDNGLLVYDSDLNQFFYWHSGNWNTMSSVSAASSDNDPLNEIQDLELNGNTLTITNNGNATPIDLSPFAGTNTDNQTLTLSATDLSISGGNTIDVSSLVNDADADPTNELQDLNLSGNILNISGGSGTNLSSNSPSGGQVLKWNGSSWEAGTDNTGTGAPLLNAGEILAGNGVSNFSIALGGDITFTSGTGAINLNSGVVGNVELANDAVNSAKISDGSITNNDISNSAAIASSKLQGTVVVEGENVSLLTNDAGYITNASIPTTLPPSGGAGGDLTGTYPNPTVAANAINSTKIANGTIVNADISGSAAIAASKLQGTVMVQGENVSLLSNDAGYITNASIPTSLPPSGSAGGDLTGTYPNPTINNDAVNSAKINDGSIVNADINNSAAIAASKLQGTVILEGENVSLLNNDAGFITSAAIPGSLPPSGAAGGDLTGNYPNPTIGADAITTVKIGNGQVTNPKIGNNAVTSAKIANNNIIDEDVRANAAIAGTKISPNFGAQNVVTTGDGSFNQITLTNAPQNGYVLTSNAAGLGSWQALPSGFSASNQIPRGNGTGLVSSNMFSDGTLIGIGINSPVNPLHVFENVADDTGNDGAYIDIHNRNGNNGAMAGIRFKTFNSGGDENYKSAILFQKFCDVCSSGLGSIKFAVNNADDPSNVTEADTQMSINSTSVNVSSTFSVDGLAEFNDVTWFRNHMNMGSNGPGTAGQVLVSNGVGTWPTWQDLGSTFSTTNVVPVGNGTGLGASAIYNNGTFVGINRTTAIGSSFFAIDAPTSGTSYGGMYINSVSATGRPFYGYALNGSAAAWTYLEGSTSKWHMYYGGNRITVQNNGDVGIGNTSPSEKLTVAGSILSTGDVIDEGSVGTNSDHWITRHTGAPTATNIEWRTSIRANNQDYWIYAYNGTTFTNFLKFDYSTGDTRFDEGDIYSGNDLIANEVRSIGDPTNSYFGWLTANEFRIRANNNHAFTVQNDGKIRMGTLQGSNESARVMIQNDNSDTYFLIMQTTLGTDIFRFNVDGTAQKPGGGTWATTSDRRAKKDIVPFNDGLNEVLKINPVSFKYNEKSGYEDVDSEHIGVIAQEIQEVLPYTVTVDEEDKEIDEKLVYDGSAIPYVLINAMKELNEKVEQLESKITSLEAEVQHLESRLSNDQTLNK